MIKCMECGFEYDEGLGACPECGCPTVVAPQKTTESINNTNGEIREKKRVNKILIGGIVTVVVLAIAAIVVVLYLKSIQVKDVSLNGDKNELQVGDEIDLTYTVTPEKAKLKNVSWSSSDASVASVQDGHVVAHKSGECTISIDIDSKASAEYSVKVIDLVELQQDSLSKLVSFIEENSDCKQDGVSMITVGSIDSETDFFIGCKGKDVYLITQKVPRENTDSISCDYNTYVVLKSGDIEEASFKQYNTIDVLGYKASSTGDGIIKFAEYKLGDKVVIDSFKSTLDNTDGVETGITDDFQKLANSGVNNNFDQLKKYLEENDDIGCTVEDLQLSSLYE